ncbi:MAG: asparagine synthase (glutamine-hydrolyzing), partial [Anaerolineales bacterium]
MCGFCGVLHWEPPPEPELLNMMSAAIAHRGPDQAGQWLDADAGVGLGFRRLAIIDLSTAGHQPMSNETDDTWLTYNGEVYNYPQLREQLLSCGHVFKSHTDSECVLHGYEEWGVDITSRLRGMFAFGLWDGAKRQLVLARDRIGIKPLYYYWDGRRFAFASEIKALCALPNADLTVDTSALWDYLTYLYIPHPKTIYRNVRQVPPGHYLVKESDKAPRLSAYWDVAIWGQPLDGPELERNAAWPEAVERVRTKLAETVEAHLLADVPVGLFLSGGLDSSSVAAFARESHGAPVKTFSIGFDVPEHTELPYARQVATKFATEHHEQTLVATRSGNGSATNLVDLSEALQQML